MSNDSDSNENVPQQQESANGNSNRRGRTQQQESANRNSNIQGRAPEQPSTSRNYDGQGLSREEFVCKNMIQKCLVLYLNKYEIGHTLKLCARIEPEFTIWMYECLEQQNPDFFREYNRRLQLRDQDVTHSCNISEFSRRLRDRNHAVEVLTEHMNRITSNERASTSSDPGPSTSPPSTSRNRRRGGSR